MSKIILKKKLEIWTFHKNKHNDKILDPFANPFSLPVLKHHPTHAFFFYPTYSYMKCRNLHQKVLKAIIMSFNET